MTLCRHFLAEVVKAVNQTIELNVNIIAELLQRFLEASHDGFLCAFEDLLETICTLFLGQPDAVCGVGNMLTYFEKMVAGCLVTLCLIHPIMYEARENGFTALNRIVLSSVASENIEIISRVLENERGS